MKITERKLRRIIRDVIAEAADPIDPLYARHEDLGGMSAAELTMHRAKNAPKGYRPVDPLNAVDPSTGESVAQRTQRVAKELEAEGKTGLAASLKDLMSQIKTMFEKDKIQN